MGETSLTLGAAVQVSSPNEDDTQWKIEQTEVGKNLYIPYGVADLDWALGPTRISGYVDTSTLDIRIDPVINGIYVGAITGSLKDGVAIQFNLFTTKGITKIYLKNGNEVWLNLHQKVKFDGTFQGDYKILTI
ncbi:hypothetical protein DTO207G8_8433 [Paecilomyces variotii]|nr:hypothetical protein DTO169C6_7182 [Paecilomyces variotii]KAJ9246973.1 hypothetical protein DTO207G8_8433 [Paecilomyces variotii]KAJ9387490.1 hypothetical protein DTO063F5_3054 [Paecilomyces variotii]KAJ9397992.1 hypothetical protein DTO282F9_5109 [Paecilomyces variotii]